MSAIDIHTHAFPDDIAGRAMDSLQSSADWQAVGDGTADGLLKSMDLADIDISAVCAIATKPKQVKGILKWQRKAFLSNRRLAGRFVPFCSVHPHDKDPAGWIRRFAEEGIGCVKLHPTYQDFVVDDDLMSPIYEAAAEHDMVLALHCGLEISRPDDPIPDRAAPARIAAVHRRFGGLRLLCTHMGGWQMWDEVRTHLVGRDVYLETSFALGFMPPEQFIDIVRDHGAGKICFGSDWPWNDQAEALAHIVELGLDEKILRQLKFKNASELLRL